VDVLQRLALRFEQGSRSVPFGVISLRSSIILTARARVTAATRSIFPQPFSWNTTLVLSIRSHRANSAFLFSVFSGSRLQLGLQVSPDDLTFHAGPGNSVRFPYHLHDGRWHHLAFVLAGRTVTLLPACDDGSSGGTREFPQLPPFQLDPRSTFRLGGSSALLRGVEPFEGAVCQFDVVPAGQVNYCKAIRKQCRENDAYKPAPPSSLQPLPSTM
ncbi:collagen alpha-1(XXVII) chain A-like, partial [Clarias magur]